MSAPVRRRAAWRSPLFLFALLFIALGSSSAAAQATRVNVMPGAPNFPRVDPHPARPGTSVLVWGNANGGDGTAIGDPYTWSFALPGNVTMTPSGPLSGVVVDDKFICEDVTFTLTSGTQGTVSATLTVGSAPPDTVDIQVIGLTDPISVPDDASLQIDVNIAIENALRRLYLLENNGWQTWAWTTTAETGFCLWAFGNRGHRASTPTDPNSGATHNEDIYAETMQRGLNHLFNLAVADTIVAANATTALGAVANGISDLNSNGRSIDLAPSAGNHGYQTPIATAGIIAGQDPLRVVTVGTFAGQTYRSIVEDCVDWSGSQQNSISATGPRGGWFYSGPLAASDMSINSWHFTALEGAELAYGVNVPDWIKQEAEHALVYHQNNAAGAQPFGYSTNIPLVNWPMYEGRATTGAGLSGLAFVQTGGTAGSIITTAGPPLDTIATKRTAALDYLGQMWNDEFNNQFLGQSNHGNFYTMWNVTRGLRLTAIAQALPTGAKVPLVNGAFTYDWEFGTETPGAAGNVPGYGNTAAAPLVDREGYFNYLVRKQDNTNANKALRGQWDYNTYVSNEGDAFETALGLLVLIPKVFDVNKCLETKQERITCDPNGEFTLTFSVVNNSGVDVHHMVLPINTTIPGAPVTVGPNVHNFSPPILDGESRQVTLTVSGATPGEQVCFLVSLADVNFDECCADELCFDLPTCDCLQLLSESVDCVPDGAGNFDFTYTFTIENLTGQVMDNFFLAGALPAGVSFMPDAFALGGLPAGGSATLTTTIKGASPGQILCFQMTIHDSTLVECCSIDVCLCLPECASPPPCLENFHCEVINGQVVLSWTPLMQGIECCAELQVITPFGTTEIADPLSGSFVVPSPAGCFPGEYCIRCIPAPGSTAVGETQCCTIEDDDCFPDPCIPEFDCNVSADGLTLTWTVSDPMCCVGDAEILQDGIVIATVAPGTGSFFLQNCKAGEYCIRCDDGTGVATLRCCQVDIDCGGPIHDPIFDSLPVVTAVVGVPYEYGPNVYDPDQGDMSTITLDQGPQGSSYDPGEGLVLWQPTAADLGIDHQFRLRATDTGGRVAVQAYTVTVSDPIPEPTVRSFRRGDCNMDGSFDLADGVRVLTALFSGTGETLPCRDACDPNDSGNVDIGDAIFVFTSLFAGGAQPAPPFPNCGMDPTRTSDPLGCDEFDACP